MRGISCSPGWKNTISRTLRSSSSRVFARGGLRFLISEQADCWFAPLQGEITMKRLLSLCFGLVALVAVPVMAQAPAAAGPTGKIHGHVINPTGAPQTNGNVTALP